MNEGDCFWYGGKLIKILKIEDKIGYNSKPYQTIQIRYLLTKHNSGELNMEISKYFIPIGQNPQLDKTGWRMINRRLAGALEAVCALGTYATKAV